MPDKISILDAAILGVIQGATEFLPISSSGHLSLANHLLEGFPDPQSTTAFFVVLHFATLLAVLWVFRKQIISLLGADRRAIPSLLVGTLPAVLLYLLAGETLEAAPMRMALVGTGFLASATFLWLSEKGWAEEKDHARLTLADAAIIGMAQALAILPGYSRSGLTISTARFRRATRPGAANFSFLLAIPAITGAVVVKAPALAELTAVADPPAIATGFLAAFLTGLGSLLLLLRVIRTGRLAWFAPYCVLMAIVCLLLGWLI